MTSGLGTVVVDVARRWIGTPYCHQASCCGAGTDCLGLIRGVWRELYGGEPESLPPYTRDWSEAGRYEVLWEAARRHLQSRPLGVLEAGDVVLFRMKSAAVAKHLGIISTQGSDETFIHAYAGHGVVESALTNSWRRRIAARFCFPPAQRSQDEVCKESDTWQQ